MSVLIGTVQDLEEKMGYLPGDCLVAAAFLSYMGPFLSNYRDEMVQKVWMAEVRTRSRNSQFVAGTSAALFLFYLFIFCCCCY